MPALWSRDDLMKRRWLSSEFGLAAITQLMLTLSIMAMQLLVGMVIRASTMDVPNAACVPLAAGGNATVTPPCFTLGYRRQLDSGWYVAVVIMDVAMGFAACMHFAAIAVGRAANISLSGLRAGRAVLATWSVCVVAMQVLAVIPSQVWVPKSCDANLGGTNHTDLLLTGCCSTLQFPRLADTASVLWKSVLLPSDAVAAFSPDAVVVALAPFPASAGLKYQHVCLGGTIPSTAPKVQPWLPVVIALTVQIAWLVFVRVVMFNSPLGKLADDGHGPSTATGHPPAEPTPGTNGPLERNTPTTIVVVSSLGLAAPEEPPFATVVNGTPERPRASVTSGSVLGSLRLGTGGSPWTLEPSSPFYADATVIHTAQTPQSPDR